MAALAASRYAALHPLRDDPEALWRSWPLDDQWLAPSGVVPGRETFLREALQSGCRPIEP